MKLNQTTWEDIDQYPAKDLVNAFGNCIVIENWQSYYEGVELLGSFFVSPEGHVSAIVHPDHRGQGVLNKMYSTIYKDVLYADIESKNIRSIKAHEKIGFTHMKDTTYKRINTDAINWDKVGTESNMDCVYKAVFTDDF